jgi:hypothetical protein
MDDDEIDDYIDPIVEAKKLKKKKKDELFVIFDYITFGSFFGSLVISFSALFSWELMPVHYNLFLTLLWFYVWVVMWIDKKLVRACFNLNKFIKCFFRRILDIIIFVKEVKLQIKVVKGVWQFLLEKWEKFQFWKKLLKKLNQLNELIYFAFLENFKLFKKKRRQRRFQIIKERNMFKLKQGFKARVKSKKKLKLFIKNFLLTSSEK